LADARSESPPGSGAAYAILAVALVLWPLAGGREQFDPGLPRLLLWTAASSSVLAIWLARVLSGRSRVVFDRSDLALGILVAWIWTSVGWAHDKWAAVDAAMLWTLAGRLYVTGRRLLSAQQIARLPVFGLLGFTWTAFYACFQTFGIEPLAWPEVPRSGRVFAMFGDPSLLAGYLITAWPFLFAVASRGAGAVLPGVLGMGAAVALWGTGEISGGATRIAALAESASVISSHAIIGQGVGTEGATWHGAKGLGREESDVETTSRPAVRGDLTRFAIGSGMIAAVLLAAFLATAVSRRGGGSGRWLAISIGSIVSGLWSNTWTAGCGLFALFLALGLVRRSDVDGEETRGNGRRFGVLLALVVAVLVAPVLGRVFQRTIADRRVAAGLNAFVDRDWFVAFDRLQAARWWQKDNLLANYSLGRLYLDEERTPLPEDYGFAAGYLAPVEERDPDYRRLAHHLGVIAVYGKDDKTAEAFFRRAVAFEADFVPARRELGMVLVRQTKFEEAARELSAAVDLGPNDPVAHAYLGNALLLVGRFDRAVNEFETAVRLAPDWQEAKDSLAQARVAKRMAQGGGKSGRKGR